MNREALIEAIFATMQQMQRAGATKFHALMGQQDISRSQMEVLLIVKHQQPLSIKKIAAEMHMTPGAVTQLLEGLVQKGYLDRQEDSHDRRITNISLAVSGKEKLREVWEKRKKAVRSLMQTLDDEELEVMLRIQTKMNEQMQKQVLNMKEQEK